MRRTSILTRTRSLLGDATASITPIAGVCILGLLVVVGTALDMARLESDKASAQQRADIAVLAAASSIAQGLLNNVPEEQNRLNAKAAGEAVIAKYLQSDTAQSSAAFAFTADEVVAEVTTTFSPSLMQLFGFKTITINVSSAANIASPVAADIDIILISDATGSMGTVLAAIQNNMQTFAADLSAELDNRSVTAGTVRVKIIFYRDFMIDGHQDWTGPT